MQENYEDSLHSAEIIRKHSSEPKMLFVNILLFVLTFFTTTIAGMEWTTGVSGPYHLSALVIGLPYSISILFILGCHEFGHYFAARFHKVKVTLPFFIPLPSFSGMFLNFGTMGAVIKTKTAVPNNKAMFDIGVAGPVAGFIASLIVLIYGFTHLPGVEYLLAIHPDYFSPAYGQGGLALEFGDTILFSILRHFFTNPSQFVPPMSEVYHYPYLCVGWFGLFVTSMNMIPIGQLDGGHVIYSMFGDKKHFFIARICMAILLVLGLFGLAAVLFNLPVKIGWTGWLFWSIVLFFIIKIKHPPVMEFEKLDRARMIIGIISIIILMLSFSPAPIMLSV
ncbi:MAG: site-2 protease family protein [Ignavibacteria bacterium]